MYCDIPQFFTSLKAGGLNNNKFTMINWMIRLYVSSGIAAEIYNPTIAAGSAKGILSLDIDDIR